MQDIDNAKPAGNASETGTAAGMSLLDAIAAYRAGSEIGARVTINPARNRLESWQEPARSLVEVIEALKLVWEEAIDFVGDKDIIPQLISVSLSFLSRTDGPMSLQPSPDMVFALRVMEFFESLDEKMDAKISKYDAQLTDRFQQNVDSWKEWAYSTDYPYLTAQESSIDELMLSVKKFIRLRECKTLGDLLAKMRIDQGWIDRDPERIKEEYPDYAAGLLRSILPLARRLSGTAETETGSQQA